MMNKHLAKLQKELDISDTHNMPSTDINSEKRKQQNQCFS